MRSALLAVVLGIGLVSSVSAASPAPRKEAASVDCLAYRESLKRARDRLAHGDREAALTELRRAREALEGCAADDRAEAVAGITLRSRSYA